VLDAAGRPGGDGGVVSARMTAVLTLLGGDGTGEGGAGLVSATAIAAAQTLGVDGVSAGLGTGPHGVVLAWGPEKVSVALEDMQFTLGQGPGVEAVASGAPVLVPDLREQQARWPVFVSGAGALAVRAVFAFPLRIGAISVGVLTAHRAAPGPLAHGQLADALALADAVTVLLLHRVPADNGAAAPEDNGLRPGWAVPETYRAEVHQASGMISVQLNVSLAEALVRLRAHAYARERPIAEIAADVVARRLRFSDSNR
jgi:hypothetical protein